MDGGGCLSEIVCSSDDRSEWLQHRKTGIGASEMAGILGVSRWSSALSVYVRKIGLERDGDQQSEAAYWGSRLERIVAEEFTRRTGTPHTWHGQLLRSRLQPWALATLDATTDVTGEVPLECKTCHFYKTAEWAEGAPFEYVVQAHQQMLVTGAQRCRIACLIGGQRFVWCWVERDDVLIRRIIAAGNEFWKRVQDHNPPAPDGSESSFTALELLHPRHEGATELGGDFITIDDERQALKKRIKQDEAHVDRIDALIRAEIGDAQVGRLANGVAYKLTAVSRAEHTVKACNYTSLRRLAPKD